MQLNIFFLVLAALCLLGVCRGEEDKVAKFPLQVSFNVTITAHQIEEASEFPPRTRSMFIRYDYINGRARADIAPGYEAEKTHIRRYDEKKEYMIRAAPLSDCKRSYLGELLPYPLLPDAQFVHSRDAIDGHEVDYFLHEGKQVCGAMRRLSHSSMEMPLYPTSTIHVANRPSHVHMLPPSPPPSPHYSRFRDACALVLSQEHALARARAAGGSDCRRGRRGGC